MKMLITAAAMTALIAGATTAKAWDQQATGAEMDYQLSQQAAGHNGAYASARLPGRIHNTGAVFHGQTSDFQLQGR